MMIDVEKYHGTGNDFVVVDANADVPNRRTFAIELCDRETGIKHAKSDRQGADGVLFLALESSYNPPRVVMTLVQPDGSVASMCGNGARCAARWATNRTEGDEVMIDTPSGTRRATVKANDITIEMGQPAFDPASVSLSDDEPLIEAEVEGLTITAVDTGVPHAVAFVDDVDVIDLEAVAPAVRHADVFADGANVTFASAIDGGFRQRTFERGVEGETRSCGTGAVAVAAVAHRFDQIDAGETITVSPPGGDLQITIDETNAFLHGPVVFEFEHQLSLSVGDTQPADISGD
jgi:diaminopimelate epimerase